MKTIHDFLPISKEDLLDREWYYYDFLIITGDAYVDHPSFGTAIISRVLEDLGFRVAILAQPDWKNVDSFTALGKPRYGVLVNGGNIDSMVAHYTAARKRRHDDAYSPGRKAGLRPDRATIVYGNKVREVWGDIPLIIGGLEASLRRFAHYDYWEDKVRRSILLDAQADLLIYGMGERAVADIAKALAAGTPVREITDVKGTCFLAKDPAACHYPSLTVASYEAVCQSKKAYAEANLVEYDEHDPIRGKAVIQPAALTLSGLDREETLEMHTLENAIVLLKPDIEPVEKAAAMMTVMRLAHSLWEDMLADWENQEDDEDMCDGCHGCDEDMLPIPAEAFEDADILYDNLRVISVDGAVLVVSDDRKTAWSESLTKAILESEKAND